MNKIKPKVSIIGIGNVGQAIVMNLYERRVGRKLFCFGRAGGNLNGIEARINEIKHSHNELGPEIIPSNNPEDLSYSEILIITAGAPRKADQTRDDLVRTNARVVAEWADYIKKYAPEGVVGVVTNPVAAMTGVALEVTGFPRERVFGIGPGLDASRIRTEISEQLGLSGSHMRVYVMGDHGEKMVIPLECITIGGTSLEDYLIGIGRGKDYKKLERDIEEKMKTASQPLVLGLGQSPWLGPAEEVANICEYVYYAPEKRKGTTSNLLCMLEGEYGIKGVVGVPVVLGRRGLIKVIEMPTLNDRHKEELREASEHIKETTKIALDCLK